MGKAQKQKKRSAARVAADPLGNGAVPMDNTAPEGPALPILKKLQSLKEDDRAWAATALSNLVLDASMRKQLLAGGAIDGLLVLLTDIKPEVAVEAAGALRNFAIAGGTDISGWIAAELGGVAPTTEPEKTERKVAFAFAEQVVALLWSLSEESDEAVHTITAANIIPFLMDIINPNHRIPFKLVVVAAQCLNTISEENEECNSIFATRPEWTEQLSFLATGAMGVYNTWDENRMVMRVLGASIMYNLRKALASTPEIAGQPQVLAAAVPVVSACLEYDVRSAIASAAEAAQAVDQAAQAAEAKGEVEQQPAPTKDSERLSLLESHMGTLQLGLELLANMYSEDTSEEGQGWEDADEGEDDEDDAIKMMQEDGAVFSGESSAPNGNEMEEDGDAKDASLLFASAEMISKVLRLCELSPQIRSPSASTFLNQIVLVQLRALGCANNLFAAAGKWYENNAVDVLGLWNGLFQIAHTAAGGVQGAEMVEGAVSAMWALVPTAEQINALIQSANNPTAADSLKVKCVGVLGILGKRQGEIETNKAIGVFLIVLLSSTTSAEVVAEALNALFDIYADAAFDYNAPVFVQGGFLAKLKELYPGLRGKVKALDKRRHRDVRERADEALTNLRAFIQYKEKEARL
ncbi:hypothetical protein HDV00_003967 [Rhizophlyctis rosea]|nr:hypothetical protein HDV00_003967 [Rhizophlyctis rosea]